MKVEGSLTGIFLAVICASFTLIFSTNSDAGGMGDARGDWWMFGREPTHNRRSPFVGAQTPTVKWRYETGNDMHSSPAIAADGTIYVGSDDDCLYAINPDGTLKWQYKTFEDVESSPAIGADGTVYVGSDDGHLYAIDPDGTLKWLYETRGWLSSSPAIGADGTIYVGSADDHLYAINPDGTLKWRYRTEGNVSSSPAIGVDGTIYMGSVDHWLYAVNPDGTLKWRYATEGQVSSSPSIDKHGTIHVGSTDHCVYAINTDGTLKWWSATAGNVSSSPAIGADGTVYVGSWSGYIHAIDGDGSLKWQFKAGTGVPSSPAIGGDGAIYVGSVDHHLYAINPDGTLKWRYETGDEVRSSPAIGADGTIYVGSEDNCLYAFGSGPPEIESAGPAFGLQGKEVTFGAVVVGSPPFSYTWNFGGGATPNEVEGSGDEVAALVTLGTPNTYRATLAVTNTYGEDAYSFKVTVIGAWAEIAWVTPPKGATIQETRHDIYGHVSVLIVHRYFEVAGRSGGVKMTASIADEQSTGTGLAHEGVTYQLSVYIDVDWNPYGTSNKFVLTLSSPSLNATLKIPISGKMNFESLEGFTVQAYEP